MNKEQEQTINKEQELTIGGGTELKEEVRAGDVLPLSVAKKAVESWLDAKRVRKKKRQTLEENIEGLVDMVAEGIISIPDEFTDNIGIKHKLLFPLKRSTEPLEELSYKLHLTGENVQNAMHGVKEDDKFGNVIGFASELTGLTKNMVRRLDSTDYEVASKIVAFFF